MGDQQPAPVFDVALVALGGAVGSLARWSLGEAAPAPWGTFAVNVSGCLLIGLLAGWVFARHPRLRLLLGVGVLGGYTTFSTHLLDARDLLAAGDDTRAAAYVVGTLASSLIAAYGGLRLGRRMEEAG